MSPDVILLAGVKIGEMRICDLGELPRYRPWQITLHSSLKKAIRAQSFPLVFSVLFPPCLSLAPP